MSNEPCGQLTFELPGRDKKYKAKELTVLQIRKAFELKDLPEGDDLDVLIHHFGGKLLPITTNCSVTELEEMRPSELKVIWEKVKEANAVFFDIAQAAGLKEIASRFKDAIMANFLNSFVSSLSEATRGNPSGT